MNSPDPVYTKCGNRQKPSYQELVEWVSHSLNKLAEKSETIKDSFVCTGIYNPFPDFTRLNHRLQALLKCEDDWDLEDIYRKRLESISKPSSSNSPSIETESDFDDLGDDFDDDYHETNEPEDSMIFDFNLLEVDGKSYACL